MTKEINDIFEDSELILKIREKLPKPGTNPRGVELSKNALISLTEHKKCRRIDIVWNRDKIEFNPYKRWLDSWSEK